MAENLRSKLQKLFTQALTNFPYQDLQSTKHISDWFQSGDTLMYEEEHTFTVATLLDTPITAKGGIHVEGDSERTRVRGWFELAAGDDWEDKKLFPTDDGVSSQVVVADYDVQKHSWSFSLMPYTTVIADIS